VQGGYFGRGESSVKELDIRRGGTAKGK